MLLTFTQRGRDKSWLILDYMITVDILDMQQSSNARRKWKLDPTSFYRRWCGKRCLTLAACLGAQMNEWIMLVFRVTQKEGSEIKFWVAFSSRSCLSAKWSPLRTLGAPQEPVSLGMAPLSSTKLLIPRYPSKISLLRWESFKTSSAKHWTVVKRTLSWSNISLRYCTICCCRWKDRSYWQAQSL